MSVFRRAAARRGTAADWLVVGLGNPPERYGGSRHNVGAEATERWASALQCDLAVQRREHARVGETTVGERRVTLACPSTFMNESGRSVGALVRRHGIVEPSQLVVVHDELDLDPGQVRFKAGGGIAGHNGLASIADQLGTRDFVRLRIGIGKPPRPEAGRKWVLQRPARSDAPLIDAALDRAVSGLEVLVRDSIEAAMNVANARRRGPDPHPQ
ncbi:aminoacyl-tRNA hydrolase [Candidatus Poriferisodalis sp.]|uniref:aminoacyl-tRNA hydrolase n=1 Tax=Candidatus Poriferisodalis sp. TaxID=3101277 RepID=UPI003B5263CE